jgi:hypothetical protein
MAFEKTLTWNDSYGRAVAREIWAMDVKRNGEEPINSFEPSSRIVCELPRYSTFQAHDEVHFWVEYVEPVVILPLDERGKVKSDRLTPQLVHNPKRVHRTVKGSVCKVDIDTMTGLMTKGIRNGDVTGKTASQALHYIYWTTFSNWPGISYLKRYVGCDHASSVAHGASKPYEPADFEERERTEQIRHAIDLICETYSDGMKAYAAGKYAAQDRDLCNAVLAIDCVEGLEEEEKEARIKSLLKGLDKQFMEYVKKTESPRFTKVSFR